MTQSTSTAWIVPCGASQSHAWMAWVCGRLPACTTLWLCPTLPVGHSCRGRYDCIACVRHPLSLFFPQRSSDAMVHCLHVLRWRRLTPELSSYVYQVPGLFQDPALPLSQGGGRFGCSSFESGESEVLLVRLLSLQPWNGLPRPKVSFVGGCW